MRASGRGGYGSGERLVKIIEFERREGSAGLGISEV